jgi:hypothetical protein
MEVIRHGGFEDATSKKALELLLVDRKNEFRELSNIIGIPRTTPGWEKIILKFCLDLDDCFKAWSDKDWDGDHNTIHKSITLIRQLAKGRATMNELAHQLNIGYTLAQEFKAIYKRLK